jgi:hypothetical protein
MGTASTSGAPAFTPSLLERALLVRRRADTSEIRLPHSLIGSVFSPELGVGPFTLHSVDTRPTKEGGAVFRTADPVRP